MNIRKLSVLAYATGFTLWHYKADEGAAVQMPGFFNDATGMLAAGDMIMVTMPGAGRILFVADTVGRVTTAPLA
jgi:hypothetical protein